jgi:hypothetical protein
VRVNVAPEANRAVLTVTDGNPKVRQIGVAGHLPQRLRINRGSKHLRMRKVCGTESAANLRGKEAVVGPYLTTFGPTAILTQPVTRLSGCLTVDVEANDDWRVTAGRQQFESACPRD